MAKQKEELSDKERLEQGWLRCRVIIEVLGKPKAHVEQTIRDYVKEIKEKKELKVISEEFAPAEPKENTLFTMFVELEMWVKGAPSLAWFCFDYMPSSVEIIEPEVIKYKSPEFASFLNDLQAKLHGIDMIVKQITTQSGRLQENTKHLLWNIVALVLKDRDADLKELAADVGLQPEKLEPFLKEMEDGKLIVKKGKRYSKFKK